ncbi:Hsp20/alpha crystallin family protein [Sediminispirochaeta smaragdinae]|uniref:Heat shock protein Hsp20 n=1 Tax=Sediminispirochaeta smaragdinae (strain DSM 11293 / JCM 15392 / SEBR 4228) TaxID=573413 RepID=E1R9F0_SEDSS|nr:Hsp20/alpha crystallin family protein [Sediminispirochaeta smaragdinae]ADK83119.1 heat shock protein Hsp20 [Sediminispirochaeta smaragdinae DSM 11293]
MKENFVIDLGQILDEVFEATRNFGESFQEEMKRGWNEKVDFYPSYSYPPVNVYITADKSMVLEFALAGFREEDLDLRFQGDYMIFSAKSPNLEPEGEVHYFKRRLKLKAIEAQRYFVPEDKYDREKVKATFINGVLRVVIPPNEIIETKDGIKIEIVREDA